jgi:hypothetical protein
MASLVKSRRAWVILAVVAITALSVLAVFHNRLFTATGGIDDEAPMYEAVRRRVPSGTAVADARRFMECEGFACQVEKDKSFLEGGAVRERADFLYCQRMDGAGFLMVRNWQVILVLRDGAVEEVIVTGNLIGP